MTENVKTVNFFQTTVFHVFLSPINIEIKLINVHAILFLLRLLNLSHCNNINVYVKKVITEQYKKINAYVIIQSILDISNSEKSKSVINVWNIAKNVLIMLQIVKNVLENEITKTLANAIVGLKKITKQNYVKNLIMIQERKKTENVYAKNIFFKLTAKMSVENV